MVTHGKRIAYGRNQNRVALGTYPDDTSVPVRTSHWNQDPHNQAVLGFTKITATLATDILQTKDDSSTTLEDDGNTYSRQSTLIEVVPQSGSSTDVISKINVIDTLENDILYLYKATESDAITIPSITPSAAGHIKTQLSGGATLNHDGVPIMLIRRGDYWYEFGADGAAVAITFTPTSTDTLQNKVINTSNNTLTVASADVTGLSTSLGLKATIASPTFTTAVTLPATDLDGNNLDNIQNLIHDTSATTQALDFNADQLQFDTIDANTTFTTTNRAIGRSKTIKLTTDGTLRTFTFPAWKFVGTKPTDQAASKIGILTITCFGTADTDIVAAYAVEE